MIIYTDASRQIINNEYKSSWAFISLFNGEENERSGKITSIEKECNTACEFIAIYEAVNFAMKSNIQDVTIKTDSKTFINFWNKWKIHNKKLLNIMNKIDELSHEINIKFEFVPSHSKNNDVDSIMNNKADSLAKKEINQ